MAGAYFYIEYTDGRVVQTEFAKPTQARQAYTAYAKRPEYEARVYGWDVKADPPTLSQQVRARRAAAGQDMCKA
jgi:hypothetical protein